MSIVKELRILELYLRELQLREKYGGILDKKNDLEWGWGY